MNERMERAGKNVLVSGATQIVGWGLSLLVTLYLPRYIGSAGLGEIAVASSFIGVFSVVSSLGTSTVLVKEIAKEPDRAIDLLATASALRLPLTGLLAVIACFFTYIMRYPLIVKELVFVFAIGMITGSFNDILGAVLQGQENMKRQSLANLAEKICYTVATICLIFCHASLLTLASVSVISGLASITLNYTGVRIGGTKRGPIRLIAITDLAKAGLPFMSWAVLLTLYSTTDPLILNYTTNATDVGWYAAASRLVGLIMFVPFVLTTALLPALTAFYANSDSDRFRSLSRHLVVLTILIGIPAASALICLPNQVLILMHYPISFSGTPLVLRVAGFVSILYFAAMALGTVIIAADAHRKLLISSALATLFGIPACFAISLLTRHIWGNASVGAIASDGIVEAFLMVAYLSAAPAGTFGRETALRVLKLCFAGIPMYVLLLSPTGQRWGLWSLLPAFACYVIFCFFLGCLDAEYLVFARHLVKRRLDTTK